MGELIYTSLRPFLISMDLHDIVIQTEIPKDVYIRGDLDWLSQAVQNILKNCMESIGDHGSVQIICEDTLLYTELRIHDSGPGFSKEDLFHLFDRFYRGKSDKTSGYGIGLALAKSVITGQGGTITAGKCKYSRDDHQSGKECDSCVEQLDLAHGAFQFVAFFHI